MFFRETKKQESPVKDITVLGIDLAKEVYQLHGINEHKKTVLRRQVKRAELPKFINNLPVCKIIMEACGTANYWSRAFQRMGHEVVQISPQHVKPFVRGNKNDKNDSKAIVTAGLQEDMPKVPTKTVTQQDIQLLHGERAHLIRERTATMNQIRGFLKEYGVFINKGVKAFHDGVPLALEEAGNELTYRARAVIKRQYDRLSGLDEGIKHLDKEIESICKENAPCQLFMKLKGVGPMSASILFAMIGDASQFKNGRHFAAFLGLVPKEHSSGGKQNLLSISKRGDVYARSLLVHGGRSVVQRASNKTDAYSQWVTRIEKERGYNKASVAVANKNARHIWAIMAYGETYQNQLMVG